MRLRPGPALGGEAGPFHRHSGCGIEVQNALAGFADHDLPAAHFVISLRTQHDLASHAFLITHFGQPGAAKFRNAFVLAQQVFVHSGAGLVALGVPFRQQFFVFGGALAGSGLFFLDLRHLGFQFQFGGLHVLVAGVGVEHQLQNLVFVGLDVLLGELDFVQQRLVLFVGFYGKRLVAILGDFALQVLNGAFVLRLVASSALTAALAFSRPALVPASFSSMAATRLGSAATS